MLNDIVDSSYLGKVYKGSWKTILLSFISTTQEEFALTNGHIPNNWLGYSEEIEKLGDAVLIEADTDVVNRPYTSKMRPLNDLSFLKRAKNVTFINFSMTCFDVTKHGSPLQNATANNILKNSFNTDTPYPQTAFGNTIPVTWLRNYFYPEIKVNGSNIFNINQFNGFGQDNLGDKSIGWLLPKKIYLYETVETVNSLEVSGSVRQIITDGTDSYAKAYPVKIEMVLTYSS